MRKTIFAVLAIIAAAAPLAAAKPLPPGDSVFVKLALPAAALNSIIKTAIAKDPVFAVQEPDKPVLTASGNSLSVANLEYGGQNGFQPQLRLTPFLASGNNTAGIRIEKFSLNGEKLTAAAKATDAQRDQLAEFVYSVTAKLSAALASAKTPNLLGFSYDRDAATVYLRFQPHTLSPFAAPVTLRNCNAQNGILSITADNGGSGPAIAAPCAVMAGQTVVNRFLMGTKFPGLSFAAINPSGVEFARGMLTVSGKGDTGMELPKLLGGGKVDAHFTANSRIDLLKRNLLRIMIPSVIIHRVYRGNYPLSQTPSGIQESVQDSLINSAIQGVVKDKKLARYAQARQTGQNTFTLNLLGNSLIPGADLGVESITFENGVFTCGFSVK